MDADVIVVGAGLAGLVAAREAIRGGLSVVVVDQENRQNLGGQAFWSFGGMFLIDTPQQRRLGVKDSAELAHSDWTGTAGFDRFDEEGGLGQDRWARRWAYEYVEFAAGEKASYLAEHGIKFTPVVGWAERGGSVADGHGNSVPRFHVPWGTGTGIVKPFINFALQAEKDGKLRFNFRHRVTGLLTEGGRVVGVEGDILESSARDRGRASSRVATGTFTLKAPAVVMATGGIGANAELVRANWPERLGTAPENMICGVPEYVDGSGLIAAEAAGARWVNKDRMWHYTEGIINYDPVWPDHGIRILPGPTPMWFDARGRRLPHPNLPGYDTLETLKYLRTTEDIKDYDHSWFIVNERILAKEFALSGSEQNPDITSGKMSRVIASRLSSGIPGPVRRFQRRGQDFLTAETLEQLVPKMNQLVGEDLIDVDHLREQIEARDLQIENPFSKDAQIQGIHNSRAFRGDRMIRTTKPHKLLDPAAGPLVAVRLNILTRKSLGGLQTDLASRVIGADGEVLPGLWAAGEAAGFGGGGVHGYRALEGTFLGGAVFSGLLAGRSLTETLRG